MIISAVLATTASLLSRSPDLPSPLIIPFSLTAHYPALPTSAPLLLFLTARLKLRYKPQTTKEKPRKENPSERKNKWVSYDTPCPKKKHTAKQNLSANGNLSPLN
ncbi:hypothetical protein B9Z19DRAFT_1064793 [Tuber borchii]|uniref:Uncharacterized protein n=1 Tax=Tuber borchii TaxID=42251 RepID=A0A2T6ZTF3_TUBBO|nr:hypothetical protein B9Z19DRAFT_1064793 [Tuber borchii]